MECIYCEYINSMQNGVERFCDPCIRHFVAPCRLICELSMNIRYDQCQPMQVRALRLDAGNYSWGSENCTRKVRARAWVSHGLLRRNLGGIEM